MPASSQTLLQLDPQQIKPDPDNVRRDGAGSLEALAASLREHGVLQPLGVARDNGEYRLVYGGRRREAAILAGLATVPCVLLELAPEDRLVTQLVENLQREDLNDLDQAEGLARLRRTLARRMTGASEREIDEAAGQKVGLSLTTVRRYLGLRDLAAPVRDLIADGQLTVTQAQHLGAIADPTRQEAVAVLAVERGLSAAALARAVKAALNRPALAVSEAVALGESDRELPDAVAPKTATERLPRAPRVAADETDAALWEAEGQEPDPEDGIALAGLSESADGHRVFRIRSVSVFCDEVDRLARALVEGDLEKAADDDPAAPLKLRLASRQLDNVARLLQRFLTKRGWK